MAFKEGIGENGKLQSDVLQKIDTGQLLYKPAAISFMRMKKDAKTQGVDIKLVGEYSGYRPCGEEGDYKVRKCSTGFTQWCAWEKYKAGAGNLAANPTGSAGCTSNHGYGIAIDILNNDAKRWVKKNGIKYGWWWGEAPSEDWHFTYDIKKDTLLDEKDIPKQTQKDTRKIGGIIFVLSLFLIGSVIVYKIYKQK